MGPLLRQAEQGEFRVYKDALRLNGRSEAELRFVALGDHVSEQDWFSTGILSIERHAGEKTRRHSRLFERPAHEKLFPIRLRGELRGVTRDAGCAHPLVEEPIHRV